ncbi:hypothetical protein COR50_10270 [Chitinophaga caeni]|uniref:DUF4329 domain-containing protein n=1 Tax=Chitinophaga caeni TaxID=2029983 RepID=A0A291QU78_9BACT|nr:hypothetical protein COR50_10270 [Chitinophaga caeni]
MHTHGNASEGNAYLDNNFSQRDISISQKKGIDGYVATPNGSLKHYDVKSGETKVVGTNIPSDPKDATRTNGISPLPFSNNEPKNDMALVGRRDIFDILKVRKW